MVVTRDMCEFEVAPKWRHKFWRLESRSLKNEGKLRLPICARQRITDPNELPNNLVQRLLAKGMYAKERAQLLIDIKRRLERERAELTRHGAVYIPVIASLIAVYAALMGADWMGVDLMAPLAIMLSVGIAVLCLALVYSMKVTGQCAEDAKQLAAWLSAVEAAPSVSDEPAPPPVSNEPAPATANTSVWWRLAGALVVCGVAVRWALRRG